MAAKRAERLVNLVIALLGTRQYVTAARIRSTVPGYEPDDGTERADEAFKRMFERDKAELREMGVPLETGRTSVFDTEDGYRIARADYELPEITLTGEEAAAVGLALRLWESAQLAGAAHSALVKLKAAGVDVDTGRAIPLQPRLDAGEPAFEPCYTAARDRRPPQFDYPRPPPGGSSNSTPGGPRRTPRPAGTSSRGASSPGTGAGTSSAWTSTARRRASTGSPASSARPRRPGRPGPSSRRPGSTSPAWWPDRSGERSTSSSSGPGRAPRSDCAGTPRHSDPPTVTTATTGWSCAPRSPGHWPTSSPPTAPTSWSRRRGRCATRSWPGSPGWPRWESRHEQPCRDRPDDPAARPGPVSDRPSRRGGAGRGGARLRD